MTKAAIQAEYRINGSNQRDTGHWTWSAPPAALAEQETAELPNLNFRSLLVTATQAHDY